MSSGRVPEVISNLLSILDKETVFKLVIEYGGTRLIVPKKPPVEHRLSELIGYNAMTTLCLHFGGEVVTFPACLSLKLEFRNAEILAGKRAGLTLSQLARKYELTERTICKALSKARG
jgi:Mor family transcriptional regulator